MGIEYVAYFQPKINELLISKILKDIESCVDWQCVEHYGFTNLYFKGRTPNITELPDISIQLNEDKFYCCDYGCDNKQNKQLFEYLNALLASYGIDATFALLE